MFAGVNEYIVIKALVNLRFHFKYYLIDALFKQKINEINKLNINSLFFRQFDRTLTLILNRVVFERETGELLCALILHRRTIYLLSYSLCLYSLLVYWELHCLQESFHSRLSSNLV